MVADKSLVRVDVLRSPAWLIAKDSHVLVLDLAEASGPKPVFAIPGTAQFNSQIARTHDRDVLINHGQFIYRLDIEGSAKQVAVLKEFEVVGSTADLANSEMNWFFAASDSGDTLYTVVLGGAAGSGVCKINLPMRQVQYLHHDFPSGIDVDLDQGIVYVPETGNQITIKSFDGQLDEQLNVSHQYSHCRLSPDGRRLVLSGSDLREKPKIAVFDLERGDETVLSFNGSHATWGGNHSIFFVRGENSLWHYSLDEANAEPRRLFLIPGKRSSETGSFAMMPVLSSDQSLLAWSWTVKGRLWSGPRQGTIVLDVKNKEYRSIKGWWHKVQLVD